MLSELVLEKDGLVDPTHIAWPAEPYKGLNFFTKDDAPLFGQREADTNACAAMVGSVTSKVLLLHGRSGAGKSSFLRAGLLPQLEKARYWCLGTPGTQRKPFLVRCTASPLAIVYETLIAHLDGERELEFLAESNRAEAVRRLKDAVITSDIGLVEVLLEALSIISQGVSRPVILTIDQSEEVFTLCADGARRNAFFYFLEELCLRHLDVKLIVALRTEYYGQFCDQLRIDPNLKVSTSQTSLNQYMLHGLRSSAQLVAAIVRPTLKEPLDGYGIPYDKYGFEFESGVAEHIAKDLIEHCGESSTLPVMQIVCRDLYHAVVVDDNQRRISLAHYNRLGRVEGRVNAFIENSIQQALRDARGYTPGHAEISRWQEVLANLVARQEGGVLTTLLVEERTLIDRAKAHGVRDHADVCLAAMADPKCRLLRVISRVDPITQQTYRQFSLGHDSLAPALFQWREARVGLLQERKKLRRTQVGLLAAAVFSSTVFGLILWQQFTLRSQTVKMYSAIVDGDGTSNFRTKILLSLASLDESKGVLAPYLGRDAQVKSFRQLLSRVPAATGGPALAIGFGPSGFEVVRLDQEGKVYVDDLRNQDSSRSLIGQIPISGGSQFSPAVGFVSNLKRPVVAYGGKLFWWNEGDSQQSPSNEVSIEDIIKDFQKLGWVWFDLADGRIRVTQFLLNPRGYRFIDITFVDGRFIPTEAKELQWPSPFWPTFSSYSGRFAFVGGEKIQVSDRSNPLQHREVGSIPIAPSQAFLAAVGFVRGREAVIVRDSRANIRLFENNPAGVHNFKIFEALQDAPVRPRMGASRPLIAGAKIGSNARMAWLNQDGIVVVDGATPQMSTPAGSFVKVVLPKPLLPGAQLDSIIRLEFSGDGRFLIAVVQTGFQDPLRYIAWDLSADHREEIDEMTDTVLRNHACKAASLEGSNQFTVAEKANWLPAFAKQPCE